MPASAHVNATTVGEKHFQELFSEANVRLRAVRMGDAASMTEAGRALTLAEDISTETLSTDQHLCSNPHFTEMLSYVEAVEAATVDDGPAADDSDKASKQYDTVLAASLKVMLRESMFAKDGVQRAAYVSRIHDWYGTTVTARNNAQSNKPSLTSGLSTNAEIVDSPKRQRERHARAARYTQNGPSWKQPHPKSATTNVFLAGTSAGDEQATAMKAEALRGIPHAPALTRPHSAGVGGPGKHSRAVPNRPQTASGFSSRNDMVGAAGSGLAMYRRRARGTDQEQDRVVITGRLSQGRFRTRNLFQSQRHRVQSNVTSRTEKRRQFNEISKAEHLHHADISESRRSHQHLIRERASDRVKRPSSAASINSKSSKQRGGQSRPATASSVAGNIYKYPRSESGSAPTATTSSRGNDISGGGDSSGNNNMTSPSARVIRERDQWLEETWLRGRSLDAADKRNQAEITAAMQQWAMNRGRIEEEIMRRQESRRYVARSGRFYAESGSYQNIRSEASTMRDIALLHGDNLDAGKGASADSHGKKKPRPRTAKSAPRAKPIVTTPVVVMRKNAKAPVSSSNKKPPMHFKYGPRSTSSNMAAAKATPSKPNQGTLHSDQPVGHNEVNPKRELTGYAKPPRARPSSAHPTVHASLSPYRGNYGHSMVSDSFGVHGSSLENGQDAGYSTSPEVIKQTAWDASVEAYDGEIAILSGVGASERVPPRPAKGSAEATEANEMKRIQEIAFGAAIRRNESLRPPPEKTTSKKSGKGKKKKKGKKKGGKTSGKKGKASKGKGSGKPGTKPPSSSETTSGFFIPRPSEQPIRPRRPVSSQGRRTMVEVESIKQAFTRRNMELPCSQGTLENALGMPEETPYSECVASLPLPGASFLSDPLAAERKALKALYMKGKGGGGKTKKKRTKKKGKGKKKKKK